MHLVRKRLDQHAALSSCTFLAEGKLASSVKTIDFACSRALASSSAFFACSSSCFFRCSSCFLSFRCNSAYDFLAFFRAAPEMSLKPSASFFTRILAVSPNFSMAFKAVFKGAASVPAPVSSEPASSSTYTTRLSTLATCVSLHVCSLFYVFLQ